MWWREILLYFIAFRTDFAFISCILGNEATFAKERSTKRSFSLIDGTDINLYLPIDKWYAIDTSILHSYGICCTACVWSLDASPPDMIRNIIREALAPFCVKRNARGITTRTDHSSATPSETISIATNWQLIAGDGHTSKTWTSRDPPRCLRSRDVPPSHAGWMSLFLLRTDNSLRCTRLNWIYCTYVFSLADRCMYKQRSTRSIIDNVS